MTTTTPARVAPASAAGRGPGWSGLLAAEWTKIRSVRSTAWTIVVFVVVTLGFTALFTWLTVANWTGPNAAQRNSRVVVDPVGFILGAGLGLGQLTLCVLGVLVITTEYSTGVIRSSLLAVPKRLRMLTAKCLVFAALLLVLGEIVSFGSFFIGSAILHSRVPVSLNDHLILRSVLGSGLYLAVLGLFSLGIGGVIRHTAGAVTTAIGVVFVLPILSGLLPGSWGAHINGYLPEQAGTLIGQAHPASGTVLSAWEGFGVFCAWTVLLLAAAALLLQRRDA